MLSYSTGHLFYSAWHVFLQCLASFLAVCAFVAHEQCSFRARVDFKARHVTHPHRPTKLTNLHQSSLLHCQKDALFAMSFVPREMENISTVEVPDSHLRGFCHYPHRGVDAGSHSCKTKENKSKDSPLPPLLNVMYWMRVSLWTVKIFLA